MVADEAPQPESTSTEIEPVVTMKGGKLIASSVDVAKTFGKNHFDVLKAIRNVLLKEPSLERNFAAFKINDLTGESTSHFEMDRDGFSLLAIGFTGELIRCLGFIT
jgi:Rha family phage regulatory protein